MSNEINQINSIEEAQAMIASEEEKKQSIYQEIGRLYFVRHSADCEADFKPFIDELVASSGKIAEYDQRILALKSQPTCPDCGKPYGLNQLFCTGCGKSLKQEPVVEAPAVEEPVIEAPIESAPVCIQCGATLKEGSLFCTACGARQEQPEVEEPAVEEPAEAPAESAPVCIQCGATLKEGSLFCTACGARQEQPEVEEPAIEEPVVDEPAEAPAESAPVCIQCGATLKEGSLFCTACGARQEQPAVEEPAIEEPVKDTVTCLRCGSEMSSQMRFCTVCGNELAPKEPEIPAPTVEPERPREVIAAPAPEIICPQCGRISAPGMRFCVGCGYQLAEESASAPVQDYGVRRCSNCGHISSNPDMPFCTECGMLLH